MIGLATSGPEVAPLLRPTALLDFRTPAIENLVAEREWRLLPEYERIGAVYDFVRDEIAFGYNESDDLPASRVLAGGIGQCNTKGTLLMALLRAVGIPCRFHGFTIDKALQKGAIAGLAYRLAPASIIHSWVEVWFHDRWLNLEGFILDRRYLASLQSRFANHQGPFVGFGVATANLQNPPVAWRGSDTYIQRDGINHDFGVFESPDEFYAGHGVNLSGFRRWLFRTVVRRSMNANISRIRGRLNRSGS